MQTGTKLSSLIRRTTACILSFSTMRARFSSVSAHEFPTRRRACRYSP